MLKKIGRGTEILENVARKEHRKNARLAKYLVKQYQALPQFLRWFPEKCWKLQARHWILENAAAKEQRKSARLAEYLFKQRSSSDPVGFLTFLSARQWEATCNLRLASVLLQNAGRRQPRKCLCQQQYTHQPYIACATPVPSFPMRSRLLRFSRMCLPTKALFA